jgi:hypothetical protein
MDIQGKLLLNKIRIYEKTEKGDVKMKKESFDVFAELKEREGRLTLFRKFDTGTWIFQFNEKGQCIGRVCVSDENMRIIQNSPSIKTGDGETKQTI